MQKKVFSIEGMHCRSCELMIAEKLQHLNGVSEATVSLKTSSATIAGGVLPADAVVRKAIESAGYRVGHGRKPFLSKSCHVYRDVSVGIVLVAIMAVLFSQSNFDPSNFFTNNSSIAVTGLVVGLTAGVSTCMALVGGLVLGLSAKHAEANPTATISQRFAPHIFFNAGRIAGFTIFGAAIGGFGAIFQLSGSMLGWLMIVVSFVMILLGLSLTGLFPRLNALTLPPRFAKALGLGGSGEKGYSWYGSMAMGTLTFFLPCGFTQAVQLMAIGFGNPLSGALIMGMFAIGTTPGLMGMGWMVSAVEGKYSQPLFRVIGVVVVALALVNFSGAVTLANIQLPDFKSVTNQPVVLSNETVRLDAIFIPSANPDITPSEFTAKVGQRTALVVSAKQDGQGCMSTIMIPGLYDTPILLKGGEQYILEFTPTKPGTYAITCAMGVKRGEIVVEAV